MRVSSSYFEALVFFLKLIFLYVKMIFSYQSLLHEVVAHATCYVRKIMWKHQFFMWKYQFSFFKKRILCSLNVMKNLVLFSEGGRDKLNKKIFYQGCHCFFRYSDLKLNLNFFIIKSTTVCS